jgi:hypothetical protein
LSEYFFGSVEYWKLGRVPTYRIEQAEVVLQARHEARIHQRDKLIKAGAMSVEIVIPDY